MDDDGALAAPPPGTKVPPHNTRVEVKLKAREGVPEQRVEGVPEQWAEGVPERQAEERQMAGAVRPPA